MAETLIGGCRRRYEAALEILEARARLGLRCPDGADLRDELHRLIYRMGEAQCPVSRRACSVKAAALLLAFMENQ